MIPLVLSAIGVAVGAVGGALAMHTATENERQSSQQQRQIADALCDKYTKLQKQYSELADQSTSENHELLKKLALAEVEKDTLHLLIELQQAVMALILIIDETPSYAALAQINIAVQATNQVLVSLDKNPIEIQSEYFDRNFKRVIAIEGANVRELIAKDPNTPPAILTSLARDLFWIREAVANNPATPTHVLLTLKEDKYLEISTTATKNLMGRQG